MGKQKKEAGRCIMLTSQRYIKIWFLLCASLIPTIKVNCEKFSISPSPQEQMVGKQENLTDTTSKTGTSQSSSKQNDENPLQTNTEPPIISNQIVVTPQKDQEELINYEAPDDEEGVGAGEVAMYVGMASAGSIALGYVVQTVRSVVSKIREKIKGKSGQDINKILDSITNDPEIMRDLGEKLMVATGKIKKSETDSLQRIRAKQSYRKALDAMKSKYSESQLRPSRQTILLKLSQERQLSESEDMMKKILASKMDKKKAMLKSPDFDYTEKLKRHYAKKGKSTPSDQAGFIKLLQAKESMAISRGKTDRANFFRKQAQKLNRK